MVSMPVGVRVSGAKKTVLLVEDEALGALSEKMTLEKYGYGVILAHTGETVLAASIKMAFRLFEAHSDNRRHEMSLEAAGEILRVTNAELDVRQKLMHYIIRHSPNAIAVLDRELRYLHVSDRYLRDYRLRDKDIIGKHHYDVLPEMPERWRDVHLRALGGEVECRTGGIPEGDPADDR